ncbi:hypothetical protein EYF80_067625 [Liparis tanakae]|uniref:Uncharacterized protein n=1 Tax=Liparis tanakae TaxID=230148 RepID=A0A4Z2E0E1_9TELE|nr:hypothetical protein EYF80_067625 [Liparis tanakae]
MNGLGGETAHESSGIEMSLARRSRLKATAVGFILRSGLSDSDLDGEVVLSVRLRFHDRAAIGPGGSRGHWLCVCSGEGDGPRVEKIEPISRGEKIIK